MAFVRLFIAITILQRWSFYQLDVKNVFLKGDLEEEIYMEQPQGFVAQGESSGLICRLRKSLYSLKQSPRAWFGEFNSVVQQFGMTQSEADHSVFYCHSRVGSIYLVVYVDDIVLRVMITMTSLRLNNMFVTTFRPKILANSYISWGLR